MTSATMTVRLNEEITIRLEKLAKATHRNKSFLAVEAITEYLKIQEWQISEIKKGVAEADAGYLIDHAKVAQRWKKKRAHSMD
jgi:predicted transcriptional regulator